MSYYPRLMEAKKNNPTRLYNKGAGRKFLQDTLIKEFPEKYDKAASAKRIKNRIKTPVDELISDIKSIIDKYNLNIDSDTITTLPAGRSGGGLSDKFPTIVFTIDDKEEKFAYAGTGAGEKQTVTSTVFKEGMVVYFFQTSEKYEAFSKRSPKEKELGYNILIDKIKKDIDDNKILGIEEKDITKILDSLKNESQKFNLDFLNSIFNAMSIGNKLKESKFGNWEIYKDSFFTKLKSDAASDLGFSSNRSDKWNPMDIILIKPGKKEEILNVWGDAKKEKNIELKLGLYNSIFIDDESSNNEKSIAVAISLKEEHAQAGKGKSYLDSIEKIKEKYNITKEEIKWDRIKLLDEIANLRKNIKFILNKNNINDQFIYAVEKPIEGFSKTQSALSKYGSLKMLSYLLEKTTPKSNIFIDIVAYGLSLGKNPTFFKYAGNKDGDSSKVKIIKFETKGGISLYDITKSDVIKNYDGKIMIRDNNTNAGVAINYYIVLGSVVYSSKLVIRTGGSTQVFVEIQKLKEIKDLTESYYPRLR